MITRPFWQYSYKRSYSNDEKRYASKSDLWGASVSWSGFHSATSSGSYYVN